MAPQESNEESSKLTCVSKKVPIALKKKNITFEYYRLYLPKQGPHHLLRNLFYNLEKTCDHDKQVYYF